MIRIILVMALSELMTLIILAACFNGIHFSTADEGLFYTAAVYEHKVLLNTQPNVAMGRQAALQHMYRNLEVFEQQVTSAAQQGAQILVFPEDAIHGFNFSRESIAAYLETVPDPRAVTWSPCADPDRFQNTEVLYRLSCMAQKNRLFLVANMPDCQPCKRSVDPMCPADGRYQFNTDVVFSENGTIVARYHKQNLYFEAAFDTPPTCEYVTFTTPFAGRFGVFTCFDILFREPAVTLVKDMGVRQFVYPTAWMNQLPLLAAVQFQRSFSYSAGVTLLAANIRSAALGMTGSGIFTPWDALYHHDTEGEAGKLLVLRVPVLDPLLLQSARLKLVPFSGFPKIDIGEKPKNFRLFQRGLDSEFCLKEDSSCNKQSTSFASTMMYDKFTLVPLHDNEGNLTACDGSFCCHLLYQKTNSSPKVELYALGAFNGLHVVHGIYYLEVCAVVRCTGLHQESCGGETEHANTLIDFHLHAAFSTEYVFAGVLGSGMTLDRPDESGWENGRFYMSRRGMTSGLVTAVLYGRVYEKDGE
ncbi:biotinidase [Tachysurus fulvidraco]|uniref:biotinidase n=1 Tax=Tachysurus fulvidraco TaxID=1234273 RepID=UPI000F4D3016|nr:biotinidase [Tachysurus fulvidraco]